MGLVHRMCKSVLLNNKLESESLILKLSNLYENLMQIRARHTIQRGCSGWSVSRRRKETRWPDCPVGRSCRIHQLLLCRELRLPQWVSWLWHTKKVWSWGSRNAGALGNAEYPIISICSWSTLAWRVSTK